MVDLWNRKHNGRLEVSLWGDVIRPALRRLLRCLLWFPFLTLSIDYQLPKMHTSILPFWRVRHQRRPLWLTKDRDDLVSLRSRICYIYGEALDSATSYCKLKNKACHTCVTIAVKGLKCENISVFINRKVHNRWHETSSRCFPFRLSES